jgi:hypothetical protein
MIGPSASGCAVPTPACELAARLSVLFERDVEIVQRLNDAQRRLHDANERLWSGVSPDAFGLVYDGAAVAGTSSVAALMAGERRAGGPDAEASVPCALQETHWAIHRSFCAYQSACEQRRQLAVEVGELAQQLTDALCAAGWTEQEARRADVHQLARAGIR